MWCCEPCRKRVGWTPTLFQSYGRCELCKQTRDCYDINVNVTQQNLERKSYMSIVVWDDRDNELGLRDKLAQLIAEVVSGVADVQPESVDYARADKLRRYLETLMED